MEILKLIIMLGELDRYGLKLFPAETNNRVGSLIEWRLYGWQYMPTDE